MWLGSIHSRRQCVGGMFLVQWCYKHVLNCLNKEYRADTPDGVTVVGNDGVHQRGQAALLGVAFRRAKHVNSVALLHETFHA